jgi:hypothetical protein
MEIAAAPHRLRERSSGTTPKSGFAVMSLTGQTRTQPEQMSSAIPPIADIGRCSRHVSKVPPAGDTPAIGLCLPPTSMLTVVSPLAAITQAPAGTKKVMATPRPFVVRTSGAPLPITSDSDTRRDNTWGRRTRMRGE